MEDKHICKTCMDTGVIKSISHPPLDFNPFEDVDYVVQIKTVYTRCSCPLGRKYKMVIS